jgi:nitrate/nitrite-specific signal transduction histidine kinase
MLLGIRWGSLRTKIIAWSFVPTALIMLAVAWVTLAAYQQVTEDLVVERDRELTRLSAGEFTMGLTEYTGILTEYTGIFASLARTDILENDPTVRRDTLRSASSRFEIFDGGVLLLDNHGTVVATEPERADALGQDWSDRSYFRHMLRHPGPVFSDITTDGPGGAEAIVVAMPITGHQGQFLGIMAGLFHLGATAISPFYSDIAELRPTESGSAYLVDGNGRAIYHSDPGHIGDDFSAQPVVQQVLSKEVGAVRTHALNGQEIVASFAPVSGTPWGLVTEESWATLISPIQSYQRSLLLLLALGVIVTTVIVTVGVRRITQPITDLIDAAQKVATGNFGQTITARTGDEIEELAEQFNLMAAQLQESYAHLEQRVAERTKELAVLNAIAATVSQSLHLDEVLDDALEKTLQVMKIEAGGIYLLDEEAGVLTIASQQGFSPQFVAEIDRLALGEGFSGRVAQSGQPLVVRDVAADPRLTRTAVQDEGLHSLAGVPLSSKGKVLGTLFAVTRGYREFTDQDVQLLTSIGNQIGVAVENARLFEAEQRRAGQFKVISEVGRHITSILAVDELLGQIVKLIQETLGYSRVSIGLIEGDELVFQASIGPGWTPPWKGPGMRIRVGQEGITGWVAATGEPLLVPDVSQEPRFLDTSVETPTRSELAVPLKHALSSAEGTKEAIIGVLNAESERLDAFDESDVAVLQSLAYQADVAIENARLFAERERRLDAMAVLNEVGRALSSTLQLDELLHLIHRQVSRVMDSTNLYIALYDRDKDWVSFPLYVEEGQVRRDLRGRKAGQGLTEHIIRNCQPLLLPDDVERRMRELGIETIGTPARSWLGVPMIAGDEVLGVIAVQSYTTENVYDEQHLNLLPTIATQAAIAIENARLYEQARQLAVMEERQRLARELHDAVTQTLFSASLIAEALPAIWESDQDEGRQLLHDLRQLSRGALAEMRTLLMELRPAALVEANLSDLLNQLGESVTGRTGVPVTVTVKDQPDLSPDVHVALYRIAQEALNNVVKHAQASQVEVSLRGLPPVAGRGGGSIELRIRDDGRGFDPSSVPSDHLGLGLGIVRERAEAIGASLEIESQPGRGTQVVVVWKG